MTVLNDARDLANDRNGYALVSPVVSLALLTMVAIIPWGLPNSLRFLPPMLPFAAVYYWTLNQRGWMPSLLVAGVGLFIDLVTYGPLGFWSLTFLVGQMLAFWFSGSASNTGLSRVLGYTLAVAIVCGVQWVTASIYFVSQQAWEPYAYAAFGVIVVYPIISFVFTFKSK